MSRDEAAGKASADPITVRKFTANDAPQLLSLMQKLAVFEDYAREFEVTETDLIGRGLGSAPEFHAVVAETCDFRLIGMAVYYFVPYTYDLRPDLILKELYVTECGRGYGVGSALMEAVAAHGRRMGCKRTRWLVLRGNQPAREFYASLGARQDYKWENWSLDLDQGTSGPAAR